MMNHHEIFQYVKLNNDEKKLLFKLILIFPIPYTFLSTYISIHEWYELYIVILIWFIFLQLGQFLFHKYCAYYQDFELSFKELYFDRYHLESYSTLSKKGIDIGSFQTRGKPISYSIFSIILSILTIGIVILPHIYTYSHKKIDHLFIGKRKMFESPQGNLWPQENTQLRQSYALFFANLFPISLIILLNMLKSYPFFEVLIVLTIYYTISQLLPILPLLGYKYLSMNINLWIANVSILIIFLLTSLLFTSFVTFITVSLCVVVLVLLIQFVMFTYTYS